MADFRITKEFADLQKEFGKEVVIDFYSMPDEFKKKHTFYRCGKLRRVDFNPKGEISKIYIGSKYPKIFTEETLDIKLI